jgi:hypothetical protein
VKRGDIVIARLNAGRVRVAEETIAPGESYARLIGPVRDGSALVLSCGVKVRAISVRPFFASAVEVQP